jgi:hypothetical protein
MIGLPNEPPVKGKRSALYVEGFAMAPQGRGPGTAKEE